MEDVRVSKHTKNGRHVGFKKYVYGRSFHLTYGTTPAHERRARCVAKALLEKAAALASAGQGWSQAAIDECFARGEEADLGRLNQDAGTAVSTVQSALPPLTDTIFGGSVGVVPRVMLYAAMERYKDAEKIREKGRKISHSHAVNNCWFVEQSKKGLTDRDIRTLTLHHLKEWVTYFTERPVSPKTGKNLRRVCLGGRSVHQALPRLL